ncbi:MAG: extracellular solute-binding protein [Planctomycetota bacterium]
MIAESVRRVAATLIAMVTLVAVASCDSSSDGSRGGSSGSASNQTPRLVLYSSVDAYVLTEVVAAFEAETDIEVDVLGDTEATKTFGLVERLRSEHPEHTADVWWSSEPFGTIRLDASLDGLFHTFEPTPKDWPAALVGGGARWHGLAERARVIAYNPRLVSAEDVPRRLRDLTNERWMGRVGMARPQFGTTRGHMAALAAAHGEDAVRLWVGRMIGNGMRLYDGNASAVRAVAEGEIALCLTDTDDVWAAQRNGAPVELVYEAIDDEATLADLGSPSENLPSLGALMLPNTIALVGAEPSEEAERFVSWALSGAVERILAQSDSRNIPVDAAIAAEFGELAVPTPWRVNLERVAGAMPGAMEAVEKGLRLE